MKKFFSTLLITFVFAFGAAAVAQEHGAASEQGPAAQEHQQPGDAHNAQQAAGPNTTPGEQLAHESKEAAGGDDHAKFKESASVKWLAKVTGLPLKAAYWVAIVANFLILAGIIYWISKSSVPAAFRNRSASIQKGIEEARKASEDANARLQAVEGRLAKLDSEVAGLRAAAEADFAQEESRIRQAAEEDARRVIETAEQEIAAAAKNARRELTAYAADLAVDLASKKIEVSENADQSLVSRFVTQLGKDGK